jgi:hypothetical protein
MQNESLQYIAHLKRDIQIGEELVLRAKVLVERAATTDRPEWEKELERRKWQVSLFRGMLQIAEEDIASQ